MKWGIVSDLGLKRYKKWEENRSCSQQSIASLLCRGANLTLHHEIGLEEKWCNYPSISFLPWIKGKFLTLACSWKKKKEKHTKNQPTSKQTPNPTKQKPWAEVKTPWKLKTEIKERKLSLNIAELQNCKQVWGLPWDQGVSLLTFLSLQIQVCERGKRKFPSVGSLLRSVARAPPWPSNRSRSNSSFDGKCILRSFVGGGGCWKPRPAPTPLVHEFWWFPSPARSQSNQRSVLLPGAAQKREATGYIMHFKCKYIQGSFNVIFI